MKFSIEGVEGLPEIAGNFIRAKLPPGPLIGYLALLDARGCLVSSEFVHV